jgi:hypothetical protein
MQAVAMCNNKNKNQFLIRFNYTINWTRASMTTGSFSVYV